MSEGHRAGWCGQEDVVPRWDFLVQLELFLSPFEQHWHIKTPFTWFPITRGGHSHFFSGWALFPFPSCHFPAITPSPGARCPLPGLSCELQLNPLSTSLHLLPFKISARNLLPFCRQIFKFLECLLSQEFLCDASLLLLISTVFS